MRRGIASIQKALQRGLQAADAGANRLYGWRFNPFYHSGALVTALMLVLLVTGVYLLVFYRIGAPYESMARITGQVWTGRWVRGLHRYASDGAVVAILVHALRLFAQGRSWGPRALAWITGATLLLTVLICGWTGYVMVWDVQAQVLAEVGAKLFDLVPLFAEPISRAFVGERDLPGAFFFLNLFLHIALPIGLGLLVWLHVSRVARPTLLPPRGLLWVATGLLLALAVVWPVRMGPPADLLALPARAPYDLFYSFWLPVARALPAWATWAVGIAAGAALLAVPLWTRPAAPRRPPPSVVDERLCTGCEQCYLDCPYEAIAMIAHPQGRDTPVARVDAALCVSCGICAGSCAPMGVGPAGRTGRDQLAAARAFAAQRRPGAADVVMVACDRTVLPEPRDLLFPVTCAGSLHSSVVEYFVRGGAGGVLIVSCPPRDCWSREGPRWLEERLYHDREAELKARVDRRRVRVVYAAAGEGAVVRDALAVFRRDLAALDRAEGEGDIDLVAECEQAAVGAGR